MRRVVFEKGEKTSQTNNINFFSDLPNSPIDEAERLRKKKTTRCVLLSVVSSSWYLTNEVLFFLNPERLQRLF